MESDKLFEEDEDFIDDEHIHAFAKALVWEEAEEIHDDVPSSPVSPQTHDPNKEAEIVDDVDLNEASLTAEGSSLSRALQKPDLITSKSDWYPVIDDKSHRARAGSTRRHRSLAPPPSPNVAAKKRKTKKSRVKKASSKISNEFRSSASYTLLRWPLLILIVLWVIFLAVLYTFVRAYVALSEYLFTWTGKRRELRDRLRSSKTYEEWIQNALELDHYLNLDKWSENPKFSYYDSSTVRLTISRLRTLRKQGDDGDLMIFLQGCLKKNFAGIENRQLYSHRYFGTKNIVEEYVNEVTSCIDRITDSPSVPFDAKRKFFRFVSKNYGKSALCLSGGACFAYTHLGVVKALLDHDLLPSIMSGTSGGGLIAALACTRTDEELKKLIVPQLARKITACADPWYVWLPRWWKTGARFDSVDWARKCNFFTHGSTTFVEAYKRTGRILNISTVPADPHSPVILCNNITSPQCIIWSSLLASSAVPGILNPVVLMMKDSKNNEVVPFSLGSKWRDGSLRTDIPIDTLNTYYNVNFSIVSQVNPHISLFFFAPKGTVGRPVAMSRRKTHRQRYASLRGGFVATALEHLIKLEIRKWLQMVKSLDLLPHLLEQDWSSIFLQKFTGTITIWPRNRLSEFWYILSDPTEERLAGQILKGERCIYPKMLFIKHRLSIERAIERGRKVSKLSNHPKGASATTSPTPKPDGPEGGNESFSDGFQVHTVNYNDEDDDDDADYESDTSDEDAVKYRRIGKEIPLFPLATAGNVPGISANQEYERINFEDDNINDENEDDDDDDDDDDFEDSSHPSSEEDRHTDATFSGDDEKDAEGQSTGLLQSIFGGSSSLNDRRRNSIF